MEVGLLGLKISLSLYRSPAFLSKHPQSKQTQPSNQAIVVGLNAPSFHILSAQVLNVQIRFNISRHFLVDSVTRCRSKTVTQMFPKDTQIVATTVFT